MVQQVVSARASGTVIPPPLVRGGQVSKQGSASAQIIMPPLVRGAQVGQTPAVRLVPRVEQAVTLSPPLVDLRVAAADLQPETAAELHVRSSSAPARAQSHRDRRPGTQDHPARPHTHGHHPQRQPAGQHQSGAFIRSQNQNQDPLIEKSIKNPDSVFLETLRHLTNYDNVYFIALDLIASADLKVVSLSLKSLYTHQTLQLYSYLYSDIICLNYTTFNS